MNTYEHTLNVLIDNDGLYYAFFASVSEGTDVVGQTINIKVNGSDVPFLPPGQYLQLRAGDSVEIYGTAQYNGSAPALCFAQNIVDAEAPTVGG